MQANEAKQIAIPPKEAARWREIVTGKFKPPEVGNLGLRLLLTTIHFRVTRDHSDASIQRSIDELHGFFCKHTWAVADDLGKLFS